MSDKCEGKVLKCLHCKEPFCSVCDVPKGTKEVMEGDPVICGICMDLPQFEGYTSIIKDRLRRRNETND
jgi:uncharacterized CHY-type Zn-finger protein